VSGRNGPFRRVLFEALRRVAAGPSASPRTNRPLLGSSGLLRGGLSRSSSTLLDVGCGPGLRPGRHDRASPGSCEPGHAPLKPIPSSVPRVLSPARPCGRASSHEVPDPCDDVTRASPMGCGPSDPAAVPPVGYLSPSAVSWQTRAGGSCFTPLPSRTFPVQSLPLARSTFTPLGAAASLAVGHRRAWCDVRSLDPPGFPDAHILAAALMGATWTWWPGSPRGSCVRFHVTAFEGGRASSAPSGPYAGLTRHSPAPSASEPCSARESVHARRRFPVAARPLLSSGSPLQSLRPVLCSGPRAPRGHPARALELHDVPGR